MRMRHEDVDTGELPRRASEWLLLLEENPADPHLQQHFARWHAADPAHARDWAEIQQTSRILARHAPALRGAGQVKRAARPIRSRVIWHGVSVALAACLLFFLVPGWLVAFQADHMTGKAELRAVRLDDGSRMIMGPDSALAVEMTPQRRTVRLLRGQGYFEVVPDANRPFDVAVEGAVVTVLGTAFEMRKNDGGAAVGVRHGRVQVETDLKRREILGAGDRLLVDADGATRNHVPPDQIATWTDGELIAKNLPLADFVDEIRPYHPGIIFLPSGDLAQSPLTGLYRLSDPQGALQAAAEVLGARISRPLPGVTIIRR